MYLYLGGKTVVNSKNVVGVFDMDNTTVSKKTRDFLQKAEKNGNVQYTSFDLPKAFLICCDEKKKKQTVFVTAISASTLKKRINENLLQ